MRELLLFIVIAVSVVMLSAGVNFFQKPFTPKSLARKVREILDRK